MTDIEKRVERAKKEIAGNESLFDMLEGDSAGLMFDWGSALAASIARRTEGMGDEEAEAALAPRLKALRGALRSIGNWAVGKYADPADRDQLKEKLAGQIGLVLGETSAPSAQALVELIDSVEGRERSPMELIAKLKDIIGKAG
jgi:hypothetical protein